MVFENEVLGVSTTKIKKAFNNAKRTVVKHSPEILTGIGIAGMCTSTVLAVKATPKAMALIEEEKKVLEVDELTPLETVKATWKVYLPAAITGAMSVTCLIGASATNAKRNAALATAYKISETALTEYKEKVVETIGEKKEKQIREEIDKDRVKKNPVSNATVYVASNGATLCYDALSGRYFQSDMETIRRAINVINRRMMDEMSMSLSEFYDEIDLEHTKVSDEIGWSIDDGYIDLEFSSQITDDGRPCLVIDFDKAPKYNYHKLY